MVACQRGRTDDFETVRDCFEGAFDAENDKDDIGMTAMDILYPDLYREKKEKQDRESSKEGDCVIIKV